MSAPASCRDKDYADGNVPKWKNPCGQEFLMDNSSGGSSSGENDSEIIDPILTAANVALEYMENFRENYVIVTFQTSYEQHLNITKHGHDYLPKKAQLPKHIGEKVAESHLKSRTLDQFLQDMYEWMQIYAVLIEQVVLDQKKLGGKFMVEFSETESNWRKVLCELRMGMYNKNITPENKVDRCVMDDSKRNLTETAHRNLRDWLIFRESMNGLEYLIQVLTYLDPNSSS